MRGLLAEPDGRLLVAGLVHVTVAPSRSAAQFFTRLQPDGRPDATFTPLPAALRADGKVGSRHRAYDTGGGRAGLAKAA